MRNNAGDAHWSRRLRPNLAWGRAYLWALVVGLVLAAAALVLNVVAALDETLGRVLLTLAILLAVWGAGLLVPGLWRVPALQPAALAALPALAASALLLPLDVWNIGPESLGAVAGGFAILLLFAFLAAPAWHRLASMDRAPAMLSAGVILVGGATLALSLAGVDLPERALESAWRMGLAFFFASLLLFIPSRESRLPVWLAWTAGAQFSVAQGIDPWVSGAQSTRLTMAAFGLLVTLGATALLVQLLAATPNEA